jgi:hypothetical protein
VKSAKSWFISNAFINAMIVLVMPSSGEDARQRAR